MLYVRLTLAVFLFDLSVFLTVDKLVIQLTISVFFSFFPETFFTLHTSILFKLLNCE